MGSVKTKKVCLTMMIKGTEDPEVVRRALESTLGYIDMAVIQINGPAGTDPTQDLGNAIREVLGDDILQWLYYQPWEGFGPNRSHLMLVAYDECAALIDGATMRNDIYALILDADEVLVMTKDKTYDLAAAGLDDDAEYPYHTSIIPDNRINLYNAVCTDGRNRWQMPRMVSLDRVWEYEGRAHHVITCDDPYTQGNAYTFEIEHIADGVDAAGGERFKRTIALLRKDYAEDPGNARTVFYLANTERDLAAWTPDDKKAKKLRKSALKHYEQRTQMGGWQEEIYLSYVEAAKLIGGPKKMLGLARAIGIRPDRAEAVYWLVSYLRDEKCYRVANDIVVAYELPRVDNLSEAGVYPDGLFIEPWCYDWGVKFEASICAYWIGDYRWCRLLCEELIEVESMPESYQEQNLKNLIFARNAIKALEEPIA